MDKQINVVYINPFAFPLGFASTKRRRYMVDYMNEHSISSHVLCTRYKKDKAFFNPQNGFYKATDFYDLSDFRSHGYLVKYYREGLKCLKKWYVSSMKNVLIFHTLLNVEDTPFFLYARELGYKILFDQVETSYIAKGTQLSLKSKVRIMLDEMVSKYAYKRCNGSFVISHALLEQNKRKYPSMSLCILPNSTPILQEKQKKSFSEIPTILYSGTFAPKDGVEYLLEAFLRVQQRGIKCKLILTGKGTSKNMRVLNIVKDNLNVEYKGMVSDDELVYLMRECDILMMTRTNSVFANCGFPFKLSEYLATGNPVIATRVSDISLILTHRKNAYLVEPENVEEIAEGIIYYIKNEETALSIGRCGLKRMQEVFSIEKVGNLFVGFLKDI